MVCQFFKAAFTCVNYEIEKVFIFHFILNITFLEFRIESKASTENNLKLLDQTFDDSLDASFVENLNLFIPFVSKLEEYSDKMMKKAIDMLNANTFYFDNLKSTHSTNSYNHFIECFHLFRELVLFRKKTLHIITVDTKTLDLE